MAVYKVSATFGFGTGQGYVGELLSSQSVLWSRTHKTVAPITISKIKIVFEGGLRDLVVEHDVSKSPEARTIDGLVYLHRINLERQSANASPTPLSLVTTQKRPLLGSADLTLTPGQRRCLSFDHIPRVAGDVEVTSITLYVKEDDHDLEVIITEDDQMNQGVTWVPSGSGLSPKRLKAGRSHGVQILPKPPKLKIELPNLAPTYFADEIITIGLLVTNEEEDDADITLDVRIVGPTGSIPEMKWTSTEEDLALAGGLVADEDPLEDQSNQLPSKHIGSLARSASEARVFCVQAASEGAEYLLEIRANYHLLSDPETPITKTFSVNLLIVLPFEASYTFQPLLSSEPWPSYFDIHELNGTSSTDTTNKKIARGLTQRWSLISRIASLADVTLSIDAVEPRVIEIHENAICKISSAGENTSTLSTISFNDPQEREFMVEAQKIDLEDRQATFLDLQLGITWRREDSPGPSTITYLAVSEVVIPFGEPRVLASAQNGASPPGVIHLDYIIENPSMYTLNFNLTMGTSEEFAFSGAKTVSVQLVPISRHTVRYNLMPLIKGAWITPQFRVFDTHFRKTLKVNATEGMRTEPKGVQVWVNRDD
jgi:hypothetical protein